MVYRSEPGIILVNSWLGKGPSNLRKFLNYTIGGWVNPGVKAGIDPVTSGTTAVTTTGCAIRPMALNTVILSTFSF
uniref:Uncharacterized protein n=1 Tax=Caenorhabditis japonica TaxID=281687 RepID=A0A8R1I841_CAEJA